MQWHDRSLDISWIEPASRISSFSNDPKTNHASWQTLLCSGGYGSQIHEQFAAISLRAISLQMGGFCVGNAKGHHVAFANVSSITQWSAVEGLHNVGSTSLLGVPALENPLPKAQSIGVDTLAYFVDQEGVVFSDWGDASRWDSELGGLEASQALRTEKKSAYDINSKGSLEGERVLDIEVEDQIHQKGLLQAQLEMLTRVCEKAKKPFFISLSLENLTPALKKLLGELMQAVREKAPLGTRLMMLIDATHNVLGAEDEHCLWGSEGWFDVVLMGKHRFSVAPLQWWEGELPVSLQNQFASVLKSSAWLAAEPGSFYIGARGYGVSGLQSFKSTVKHPIHSELKGHLKHKTAPISPLSQKGVSNPWLTWNDPLQHHVNLWQVHAEQERDALNQSMQDHLKSPNASGVSRVPSASDLLLADRLADRLADELGLSAEDRVPYKAQTAESHHISLSALCQSYHNCQIHLQNPEDTMSRSTASKEPPIQSVSGEKTKRPIGQWDRFNQWMSKDQPSEVKQMSWEEKFAFQRSKPMHSVEQVEAWIELERQKKKQMMHFPSVSASQEAILETTEGESEGKRSGESGAGTGSGASSGSARKVRRL